MILQHATHLKWGLNSRDGNCEPERNMMSLQARSMSSNTLSRTELPKRGTNVDLQTQEMNLDQKKIIEITQ